MTQGCYCRLIITFYNFTYHESKLYSYSVANKVRQTKYYYADIPTEHAVVGFAKLIITQQGNGL